MPLHKPSDDRGHRSRHKGALVSCCCAPSRKPTYTMSKHSQQALRRYLISCSNPSRPGCRSATVVHLESEGTLCSVTPPSAVGVYTFLRTINPRLYFNLQTSSKAGERRMHFSRQMDQLGGDPRRRLYTKRHILIECTFHILE